MKRFNERQITEKRKKKRKGMDVNGMHCPYCGGRVFLRSGEKIHNGENRNRKMYVCEHYPECDTYVQAHEVTNMPMGSLANKELRKLRRAAHYYFDQLFLSGLMSREEAYLWLSEQISAPLSEAHIGHLREYYCREVIIKSKALLRDYTRKGTLTRKGKCCYEINKRTKAASGA